MKKKTGFAAISAVLIVSAITLAVVMTVSMVAIGEGQAALAVEMGNSDQYLVDGCTEDILQKIHDNRATKLTTITRPDGTCSVTYNHQGPVNWDVVITETGTNFGKKNQIIFTRGQTLILTSWMEI